MILFSATQTKAALVNNEEQAPVAQEVVTTPEVEQTKPTEPPQPEKEVKQEKVVAKSQEVASVATTGAYSSAKQFIYDKESTNRLDAVNSIGCYGLGQDCNNQLSTACPNWRTDRACQDEFWEAYMSRRYGSWEKAKAHWQARVPIKGKDVGHWW